MHTITPLRAALLVCSLSLWAAAPQAQAQSAEEFAIRGPRLSGRAVVAGDRAELTLIGDSLGDKSEAAHTQAAQVERLADGGLRLSYSVVEQTRFLKGFTGWLRHPGFNRSAWAPSTRLVVADLRPLRSGALRGTVDGVEQIWTQRSAEEADWTVLVVPGLSTNSWNKVGIPYLDENLRALEARGLSARRVAIKTEDGVAKNALFLAEEIRREAAAGKRVVLMAHSKGGTDVTAALALYPDLRPSVVGVIAIQPVYGGSFVADLVAENKVLRGPMALVFEGVFKGQREAVIDLTHESRAAFVAAHPYPADEIPTVVIRSSFERTLSKSSLWPSENYITARHKVDNDGLVSVADQRIPGAARELFLADLDHFEPGVRLESPHAPIEVTTRGIDALLSVLRERAAAAAAPAGAAPSAGPGRALGR